MSEERLRSFKGLLQTDGYAGYQKLRERTDSFWLHDAWQAEVLSKYSNYENPDGIAAELNG